MSGQVKHVESRVVWHPDHQLSSRLDPHRRVLDAAHRFLEKMYAPGGRQGYTSLHGGEEQERSRSRRERRRSLEEEKDSEEGKEEGEEQGEKQRKRDRERDMCCLCCQLR